MRVEITVESDKGQYWPGTAIVKLDSNVIAKLRGGEGIAIITAESVTTERLGFTQVTDGLKPEERE